MKEKETLCEIFDKCGGCKFLNIEYHKQLENKDKALQKLFHNVIDRETKIYSIIGMKNPYNYRNKGKYVLGNINRKYKMGLYEEGTHRIVNTTKCALHSKMINEVASYVFELIKKYKLVPYNEDTKHGLVRHLIIRYGINTNEIMIIFVTANAKISKRELIVKDIIERYPNVKTIVQNINEKESSAVLGDKNYKLYGNGYIVDKLGELKFKISPLSFYQVNPVQTKVLYSKAIEFAELTGDEIIYDLYSGIGTISLFASKHVKEVIGIESVKDAVKDAIQNAKLNNIGNAKFLTGRVENVLPEMIKREKKADVIFVDPTRIGLDKNAIETLLSVRAKKIIYISCNPESLVQDLKKLKSQYKILKIQPVDMFPQTSHVETVVQLVRKIPDTYIDITVDIDELDLTSSEARATYEEIKDYIFDKYRVKISSLYIAQVKQKHGIIERECYNNSKKENLNQPQCPSEKVKLIEEALRHFKMIP